LTRAALPPTIVGVTARRRNPANIQETLHAIRIDIVGAVCAAAHCATLRAFKVPAAPVWPG
jgi:hypothetical protein